MKPLLLLCMLLVATFAVAEEDRFDPHAVFKTGPFAGQAMDTSMRRSIKILSGEEAARYGAGPNEMVVANFYHEGKFWIARVPTDAVQDVIFQIQIFPAAVPAAHTQLRFRLKPGRFVELFSQVGPELPKKARLNDFIFTSEAVSNGKEEFDVFKGLHDHFGLALRFVSTENKYDWMVGVYGHRVEQVKLILDEKTKNTILRNALVRSDQSGLDRMYNTWRDSCTTEAFDTLDRSMSYGVFRRLITFLRHYPAFAKMELFLRGLNRGGRSALPLFNDEMSYVRSGGKGRCPYLFKNLGY